MIIVSSLTHRNLTLLVTGEATILLRTLAMPELNLQAQFLLLELESFDHAGTCTAIRMRGRCRSCTF